MVVPTNPNVISSAPTGILGIKLETTTSEKEKSIFRASTKNAMPIKATKMVMSVEIPFCFPLHNTKAATREIKIVYTLPSPSNKRFKPETAPKIFPASYAAHPNSTDTPMNIFIQNPLWPPNFLTTAWPRLNPLAIVIRAETSCSRMQATVAKTTAHIKSN